MSDFTWSEPSEKAAQLIAAGNLTLGQVAESAGVARSTLWEWRRADDFQARVEEHLAEIRAEVRRIGLATVEARVAALNDRWGRMRRVIEARASDPQLQSIPGGKEGLIVRDLKGIGKGADFQVVETYQVDTGLLKELREHEKQAAQELGQWAEKREITAPDGIVLKAYIAFDPDEV